MVRGEGFKLEGHPAYEEYKRGPDGNKKRWPKAQPFSTDEVSNP